MSHQGEKTKKASTVRGRMKVSDAVQIPLSNADFSKCDDKTLTLVVVELKLHDKETLPHKLAHNIFQT